MEKNNKYSIEFNIAKTNPRINYQSLFDSLYYNSEEHAILIYDSIGKLIDHNKTTQTLFGGNTEWLLSIKLNDLFGSKSINDVFNISKSFFEGVNESHFESELLNQEGNSFWANILIRKMFDEAGSCIGYILFIRDITEKVTSDKTIRSIAKYPEENPLPVLRISAEGEIIYSNAASRPLLELLHCAGTMKVPEDMLNKIKGSLESKQSMNFEMNMNQRSILFTIVPIETYVNLYGTDITELKLKERELIKAKERIEKSDKLKSEFLARMSHEIRTPLNVIIGNASMIKEELIDHLDEDTSMMFDMMRDDGKRLMRTVQMILDASLIETGTLNIQNKKLDFHKEIMEELIIQYKKDAEAKRVELNYSNRSDNTKVTGDVYILSQSVDQLLNNAVKFTNKGWIDIKFYNLPKGSLCLDVTDTGIGISEEFRNEMFNWFSTEEKGYARNFEGNGLGLALAKRLCDLNNIRIEVKSEKGTGSTFKLIFPSLE